ncbi:Uma2 family endonuclease [bacterium]|nr:Uma2 family endonuclease [bacterium]
MQTTDALEHQTESIYPESDGQPMADNTLQFRLIVTIQGGLDLLLKDDPHVFVAGDLLWYPVEGNNRIRVAPDTMVVFGRPKGHRGAYLQWREDNIAPQIVFEILSPGNTVMEMTRKLGFYDRYGVEEYYLYDPDHNELSIWLRARGSLREVENTEDWVSPRLGIRFKLTDETLIIYRPDGAAFESYVELGTHLEQERQRAERLREKLRELGVDPEE